MSNGEEIIINDELVSLRNEVVILDIVGTVHHLVIYMQSSKIHKVILMRQFIHHIC